MSVDAVDGKATVVALERAHPRGEGSRMSASVENTMKQVVVCSNCQTKNRVPAAASGVPRCGKCQLATPLGGERD
jgi:hypothetical protein